jgi:hypothetical protein
MKKYFNPLIRDPSGIDSGIKTENIVRLFL